ncbi:GNAT family N-acetyltransferase [Agromyces sp. CFH 90414]|uniref:GNAT family N-acetyltransferase n=1 Tax=Agromyces agglutinans TaxID=2662258 RepID=A0A6I2FEV1_9MICO|nr:GNAT family protein [Agromyces agglutinans]MRG61230.1 GNAT family N-acetyltransferase [Agromyces agglutinans]
MPATIRLLEPADAPRLAHLQTEGREFFAPWDKDRDEEWFTVAGQEAEIAAQLRRHAAGEGVPFAIVDPDGELVGRVNLTTIVRGPFQSCSMGYWLSPGANGKGYATDAVRAVLETAFGELGLHRVEASTLRHNERSQRVLERSGFTRFGMAPRYLKIAGAWQDHVLFQRLADDD